MSDRYYHSAAPATGTGHTNPALYRTDFEEKYPPDREPGKELADTARVWKVYRGQAIEHDDSLLRSWNDTVNILLTFAGLFSAAVTSFVIASTDDLKPDPNAYVANALFAMLNSTIGTAPSSIRIPQPPSLEAASPSSLSRAVSGLWYMSLFLSLAAALLCILIKQWLDEYVGHTRAPAKHLRQWAQRREFYFQGLADWNVPVIVSFLPILLHLALFSFLVGLSLYLWTLDRIIAGLLLGVLLLLVVSYLACFMLPLWNAACPYATPLLNQLLTLPYTVRIFLTSCQAWPERLAAHVLGDNSPIDYDSDDGVSVATISPIATRTRMSQLNQRLGQLRALRAQRSHRPFHRILETEGQGTEEQNAKFIPFDVRLECDALLWLIRDVSEGDSVAVAWQSLGALLSEPNSSRARQMKSLIFAFYGGKRLRELLLPVVFYHHYTRFSDETLLRAQEQYYDMWLVMQSDGLSDELNLARITRSWVWLVTFLFRPGSYSQRPLHNLLPDSAVRQYQATQSPDAALFFAFETGKLDAIVDRDWTWWATSSTITTVSETLLLHSTNPAWITSLIACSTPSQIAASTWQYAAKYLGCTQDHDRFGCDYICVVNALVRREPDFGNEVPGSRSRRIRRSAWASDVFLWGQVIARILADKLETRLESVSPDRQLSLPVWEVLTSRQSQPRITSVDIEPWSKALVVLAGGSRFLNDATCATSYIATWRVLLRGPVLTHSRLYEVDGKLPRPSLDLHKESLARLTRIIPNLWSYTVDIPTSALPMRRSLLELYDTLAIALVHQDIEVYSSSNPFFEAVGNLAYIVDSVSEEDGNERHLLQNLLVRIVQHCIAFDSCAWESLRNNVEMDERAREGVRTVYREILDKVKEQGPCKEGSCAGKDLLNWPAELHPTEP